MVRSGFTERSSYLSEYRLNSLSSTLKNVYRHRQKDNRASTPHFLLTDSAAQAQQLTTMIAQKAARTASKANPTGLLGQLAKKADVTGYYAAKARKLEALKAITVVNTNDQQSRHMMNAMVGDRRLDMVVIGHGAAGTDVVQTQFKRDAGGKKDTAFFPAQFVGHNHDVTTQNVDSAAIVRSIKAMKAHDQDPIDVSRVRFDTCSAAAKGPDAAPALMDHFAQELARQKVGGIQKITGYSDPVAHGDFQTPQRQLRRTVNGWQRTDNATAEDKRRLVAK